MRAARVVLPWPPCRSRSINQQLQLWLLVCWTQLRLPQAACTQAHTLGLQNSSCKAPAPGHRRACLPLQLPRCLPRGSSSNSWRRCSGSSVPMSVCHTMLPQVLAAAAEHPAASTAGAGALSHVGMETPAAVVGWSTLLRAAASSTAASAAAGAAKAASEACRFHSAWQHMGASMARIMQEKWRMAAAPLLTQQQA